MSLDADPAVPVPVPIRTRLGRARHRTFSSLGSRNYRLFFFGQLVSNTGNWLTIVALTLLVLHRTNSGVAVGALSACQFGPILLLSAWAGAIADRHDKRRLLFLTQSLEMLQSAALAVLAFLPHAPLGALFATAFAGGIFLSFDNPLRRSFVTEMVPREEMTNAVALYSAMVNASRIFGPALAGVLVVAFGFGWGFTVDSASYVFVIAALAMMRTAELRRAPPPERTKGEIRAGLRYVASQPNLRISFIMLAVVGVLGYNLNVGLPLFVEHSLHRGDAAFTLLYSLFSTGALVSALVVAGRSLVRLRHILIGAAAFGIANLLLAPAPNIALAIPAVLLVGVTSIMYMTATTAIVQVEADPSMHGRILALQAVLLVGSAPIGGPLVGIIADLAGARAPLVMGGVASIAAAAWGWSAARKAARA
ncbi:MAG TPA: MFS transporter [Acidimicrobiia bacterium]|nr:MFS transporter [Acidimicrobiia bacterium]